MQRISRWTFNQSVDVRLVNEMQCYLVAEISSVLSEGWLFSDNSVLLYGNTFLCCGAKVGVKRRLLSSYQNEHCG